MADAIMAGRGRRVVNYAKDWEYTTNDTATLVTKYIGTKRHVVVPNKIEGKPVVLQNSPNMYSGVFTDNGSIISVQFTDGVKIANNNMGNMFAYCRNLVNAPVIPANVTNMDCTFQSCTNLVNAPDLSKAVNVKDMSDTFGSCWNLVNAPVIPANVVNMSNTFHDCSKLVNAPIIPANVTNMYSTFVRCYRLINISNIPSNVTNMYATFENCTNLTGNIFIKSNRLGNNSMRNCFKNTTLPKNVYIPSTGYNAIANTWNAAFNAAYGINGKNGVTVRDIEEAFPEMSWQYTTNATTALVTKYIGSKTNVVVPNKIKGKNVVLQNSPNRMNGVFTNNKNITSVRFSDGVKFANNSMANAFEDCSSLVNAPVIPNSVTSMDSTFGGCRNLVNAPVIPNNVTSMYYTFYSCYNLKGNIYIKSNRINNTSMQDCFGDTTLPKNVYISKGSYTWNAAFNSTYGINGKNGVTVMDISVWEKANWEFTTNGTATLVTKYIGNDVDVVVPDTINGKPVVLGPSSVKWNSSAQKDDYSGAFVNNQNIISVRFSDGVKFANNNMDHAFSNCRNLVNAPVIPNGVTSMFCTFENCCNLVNAPEIHANVTNMVQTFLRCHNLVNAPVIPNSVTEMRYTFGYCANLVNAPVIPAKVTDMYATFTDCKKLVNAPEIPANVWNMQCTFSGCENLVNAPVIPANVTNMYFTFRSCENLVNAPKIPANVTNMYETFFFCSSLVNAPVIPNSVTGMAHTFAYCDSLVNAPVIPNSVTNMSETFKSCTNLTGNIVIKSNCINNTSMQNCFNGTTLSKNVYIPYTGYSSTANTRNAAFNTTYGIDGKNGVTVHDINTYKGSY